MHAVSPRNIKLTLEYDGTNYVGWQRQPIGASIQGLLEDALAPIEAGSVTVHGAGRTDAGVHALGQVASVTLASGIAESTLVRALNAVLPPDIRVLDAEAVPGTFHARFSARSKTYEYRVINAPHASAFLYRYAWHVPQPLDVDAIRAAAAPLAGRHDFAGYRGAGSVVSSTERTVLALDVAGGGSSGGPVVFRITADGFLRYMVRNIVGTLIEVGLGRAAAERPRIVLESRDRSAGGPTAPPQGLFLIGVAY